MKIYRDGIEIYEVKDYKQNGRFMEIATIDCTIKSPTPLVFKVGDYVVSEHNGIKFSIYEIYPEKKQARKDTYGEAFIYDLKFKSNTEELNICPFLDIVPNDNNIVYTSLPSWSTYENVYGIVARIQANMDYLYPNRWLIRVADTTDVELLDTLNEAREFTISGESCFEGLKKIHDNWAVGYIHTYEDGKDVITIGKSAGTTSLFRYGKGQGLKTIKKNIQNTDQFCTRALVFGSTRNMPARWYNTKGYINESQYIPNLMIPPTKWVGGVPQGAYIDAIFGEDNRIEKYGLKIKTLSYDGSDSTKDEIFPSVEKVTAKNIRDAKAEISDTEYIPSPDLYPDNERMDQVLIGSNITDSGIKADEGYKLYSDYVWYHIDAFSKTITIAEVEEDEKERYNVLYPHLTLELATYNITKPANYRVSENPDIITLKKNDRHSAITAGLYLKKPSGDYIKLSEITFKEELESDLPISNALGDSLLVALDTVGIYSLEARIDVNWSEDAYHEVYLESGEGINLDLIVNVNNAYTTLSRGENIVSKYFDIKIKQIGFDINDVTASSGSPKRIHFKSGMCAGRSFDIRKASYNEEDDSWILSCRKIEDSSTSLMYPNNIFQIQQGDQFVLLNIVMPDLYIYTAMQRLYDSAYSDLQYLSNPQYVIEPEIDNLQIARSPQTLAEGMYMPIEDGDLNFNDEVLIDSVVVTYKDKELPKYEVTLRNGKIFNRFSKIASRISELENAVKQSEASSAISNVESDNKTESLSNSGNSQQIENNRKAIETIKSEVGILRDMWVLDPANGAVRTRYNVIADGTIAMKDLRGGGSGEVAQGTLDGLQDVTVDTPTDGQVLTYDESIGEWVNKTIKTGLDTTELEGYLTTNQYAKKSDIPTDYAKATDLATLRTDFDNLNTLLNGNVGGVIDNWNEVVSFLDGYSQSDDLATILSGMNSDIADRVLIEDFEKLEGSVTEIAGYFTNGSANNALKLGGQLPSYYATTDALNLVKNDVTEVSNRVKTFEDVIGIDSNGDVYIKGTRNFYTAGGTISMFGLGEGDSGEVASVAIKFEGSDDVYSAVEGIITLPAYPSGGGVADSVDWANVANKPTTLAGYGITDALSVNGGTLKGSLQIGDNDNTSYTQVSVIRNNGLTYMATNGAGEGAFGTIFDNNTDTSIVLKKDNTVLFQDTNYNYHTFLHSGNYGSYALPLSGGTLTGDIVTKSFWSGTDNVGVYFEGLSPVGLRLQYQREDKEYDQLLLSNGVFKFNSNEILDTHNYSNYTLPLSGGTITGGFGVYNPNGGQHTIAISTNNGIGWLGYNADSDYWFVTDKNWYESYRLYHSGNFNPSDYLPLSGGTLQGTTDTPLYLNGTTGSYIGFRNSSYGILGYFGFDAEQNPNVHIGHNLQYNLIHSGNIGSQSVNYANSAARLDTTWYEDCNYTATSNLKIIANVSGVNGNYPTGYASGLSVMSSYVGWQMVSYGGDIQNPFFRSYQDNGTWKPWRQLAFLDDNVASATKLQTARTIWGQSFDGSADVSGNATFKDFIKIYEADTKLRLNHYVFDGISRIYGYNEETSKYSDLWLGNNLGSALVVKSNGNVLIGKTEDNGHKLQVNGSITTTEWLYSDNNYGMYISNSGVYYSNHANYANIESAGNEMCIGGNTGDSIYVNYRVPRHYGVAPTSWVWCAGSSDSRADFFIGNLVATGTIAMGTLSSSSDARLKDNIKLLTNDESLAVLRRLRPSKWNWKSNGALSYGFIAQEVEGVASCMVDRMNDEELGQKLYLQYNQLHAFEVGAIQHIDNEVEQLKKDLKTANTKIENLENELKQYRLCQ